jgi:hypothetical protein
MIDRKTFFDAVRAPLFGGRISARQSAGLTAILDRWESRNAMGDVRWLAYMLATAQHETARTMQPIRERGGRAYLTRLYDIQGERPALAQRNGNTTPGDGVRYAGRGYVQLTWKDNYVRASERLGIDLAGDPDRALEPRVAADIMFFGMAEGWFTGRLLCDYFNGPRADWLNARRIVNRLDQATTIRTYALAYNAALGGATAARTDQPIDRRTASRSTPTANAQAPRATNSAPVAARGRTASGAGA